MLRYGGAGHGGSGFYCDNDLGLTELYPITVQLKDCAADEHFNHYTQYCYSVIILEEGSLRINSRNFNSTLSSNQLIIADPFNPCFMHAAADCRFAVIRFTGSRAPDFSPFCGTIYPAGNLFAELSALTGLNSSHDVFIISFLYKLYGFLGVYKVFTAKTEAINRYVKMAMDNIDNSYLSLNYSLEVLAADLKLTPSYLSRLFKKEVGVSMQEYLKNKRLSKGYELLVQGYKVKDAAEKCGIRHVNNFSEMFSKRYGIRPSEVKQREAKPGEANDNSKTKSDKPESFIK